MYNVRVIISINALMCKHHFNTVPSDDAYVECKISACDASQETMVVLVLQTPIHTLFTHNFPLGRYLSTIGY